MNPIFPVRTYAIAALIAFGLSPIAPAQPVEVNAIAAKVNGRVITVNQVNFLLAPIYAQLVTQYPRRGPQFEAEFIEARNNIIQELVDREIILDEFKQKGATIRPHIIDEEVKRQMRELFGGDEAKFRDELKRSRLTMEGFRQMTEEKMIVQAMRAQQFTDAPPPLPSEVRSEYQAIRNELRDKTQDKVDFQKIFIPSVDPQSPGTTPDSQLDLAEKVANQIREGADFAELARTHSRDAFANDGGVQKEVARLDLSPEFATIVIDAPVGKLIGPLLDPAGFTIVQTLKLHPGPVPSFESVREQVEERVRRKKTSAQYERWIESRRKRAMIEIRR